MRLIDADALIENRDIHIVIGAGDNICIDIADIAKAPTIDAEPVRHGRWIDEIRTYSVMDRFGYVREEQKKTHICSLCRVGIVGLDNMRSCPKCCARMDGESE